MQFLSRQRATAPFTKRSLRKCLLILYRYFFDKLKAVSSETAFFIYVIEKGDRAQSQPIKNSSKQIGKNSM